MSNTTPRIAVEPEWTPRQRQVLDLLARGRTNPEIAEALDISLAGAKWHVSEVISKLGVSSREDAAAWWREERRLRRRVAARIRGWLALPALKLAAGVSAVGVAATAIAIPLALSSGGGEAPAQTVDTTPEATPGAPFTRAEAEEWAKQLAVNLLAPIEHGVSPPGPGLAPQQAQQQTLECLHPARGAPKTPEECGFRDYQTSDYEVIDNRFLAGAREVETNILGVAKELDSSTNVWVFDLARQRAGNAVADVRIIFEDGTGRLVAGGRLAESHHVFSDDSPLASFTSEGVTFWLVARQRADFPGPFSGHGHPDEWCLGWIDSRQPIGTGFVCDGPKSSPFPALFRLDDLQGFSVRMGLVSDDVASVRLTTTGGSELLVEPGYERANGQWRGFIAVTPAPGRFVAVDPLDAGGNLLAAGDYASRPR